MKEHYGQEFVPRIAHRKTNANGNGVCRRDRHKIIDLIKAGRRMERRTSKQKLKKYIDK